MPKVQTPSHRTVALIAVGCFALAMVLMTAVEASITYKPPAPSLGNRLAFVALGGLIHGATFFLFACVGSIGWLTLRSWRRRRDERCEQCGYNLSGLHAGNACPECGTRPRRSSPA